MTTDQDPRIARINELWAQKTRRERGLEITCAVLLVCVAMLGLALVHC